MAGNQHTDSNTSQQQNKFLGDRRQQLSDVLNRAFLGQMVNPPETQPSVPHQQAVSNLQGGLGSMVQNFGLGGLQGGLASRLSQQPQQGAPGTGPGALLPGAMQQSQGTGKGQQAPQQWGLQSRESLGIPSRRDNMTFVPTAEEIAAIGIPPVRSGTAKGQKLQKREDKLERREGRVEARIERRTEAGKGTQRAERKLGRVQSKLERVRGRQDRESARGEDS